jgi:hypothetical protein
LDRHPFQPFFQGLQVVPVHFDGFWIVSFLTILIFMYRNFYPAAAGVSRYFFGHFLDEPYGMMEYSNIPLFSASGG